MVFSSLQAMTHIFAYTDLSEDKFPLAWVRVMDSSYIAHSAYSGRGGLISERVV